ncbi:MAG: hypothetical protein HQ402_01505 [Parcubacteria group bacterium]|nr:hypothetical protein [Parcubacteria group bacterium]
MDNTRVETTPKDFFLHLGVIVTLYVAVISLINLLFTVIDTAFPKVLQYNYHSSSSISWPVASLIIIFPLYIFLSWLLIRDYKTIPAKRDLGIRKWLLYITLFVTGIAVITDLITLIYYFLDGQTMTAGFILKVLTVLVVAGVVFVYYISDLKGKISDKNNKIFAIIAGVIVLASIVVGFVVIGSPATQRERKHDDQRVNDLQGIQGQVVNYWQQKEVLPKSLEDLSDPIMGFVVPKDPKTGDPYSYEAVSKFGFKLCAVFGAESIDRNSDYTKPIPVGYVGPQSENWKHSIGESCFDRIIDPQKFPPYSKRI